MAIDSGKIGGLSVFRGFMRSFLVQAGWNTERMQNIGFTYSLIPLIGANGSEADRSILSRHLEFFNTHPYLAGALVAAVGRMEKNGEKEETIRTFKQSMMGPFGALGDSLFWFSLKPVAVLMGVALALMGKLLLAILVPLVFYNVFHLWMRAWGYQGGIRRGSRLVSRISSFHFSRMNVVLGVTAAAILAALAAYGDVSVGGLLVSRSEIGASSCALVVAVVFLVASAIKRGLKPVMLIYLAAGFGMITALALP